MLNGHNPATGEWNDSLNGDFLWSNVNVGEAYAGVMTPFTWSMIHTAFSEISLLPGYDLIGNIGGHLYNNISVTVSMFRALGKNVEDLANEFGGGFDKFPDGMTVPEIPLPRSAIFPILRQAIRMRWKLWQALNRKGHFLAENPDWCQRMMVQAQATRSTDELFDLWYSEIAACGMENFWLLPASVYQYGELAGRLRRELFEMVGREDADILMSNVSNNTELLASLGLVVGLWQLFCGKMTREEFLGQYGHRGPDEGEYLCPRPAEDPQWLDRQLAAFAQSPVDVEALLAKQRAEFDAAWARFQDRYPRRVKSVSRRLEKAAAAARLREAVRSEMMRLSWVSRTCALHAGKLTGLGDGAFFLSVPELEEILRGKSMAATQFIPARRQTYERYKKLPPYPAIIRGQFDPFEWAADSNRRNDVFDSHTPLLTATDRDSVSKTLIGSAGSAGRVEGVVRRLDSPEEGDRLQAGEILVAAQTNIGWTLLFPRAAAIVTDVGAPLSHAAIVARELGIPAVVGCGNATMRLKNGDRVRVDGVQGIVEILD